ncbi:AbrB/MazE/SpoVT family DNA-binding domain-containing protein [Methanococcoides burtonii]|uniref:Protein with SpoVT/AbrB-like domain n=1 Tax=Methanococcoides burtonii (strain DSM 6242 / NBRC 107633 / OCM 468 / ACE-M) TaxID=259564 RepID=Q12TS3_METBU|nr:AbrB/MazE/SpoVT family DNA-binding domain-containing protein [Methanococcoides burtonii]ABE53153.1 Protein with SpoVT/AbrB-like domain [Methanococcoides burtonii DSM 6242]
MAIVDIRTATITSKGQIVIPSSMRKGSFDIGHRVAVIAKNNHIEIRPLSEIEDQMETAIASEKSLAKLWDTPEEDEAWNYL